MSSNKIIVTNISSKTPEFVVKNFIGFVGKIRNFELIKEDNGEKYIAYITFEKESSARAALLLTNSIMGESLITVKPAEDVNTDDAYSEGENLETKGKYDKAVILAEILAAGYQLQDTIYETGSGIDVQEINEKYKVVETVVHKASEIDNKYSVQDKVRSYASQAQDKATQALNTEPGKYAHELYTTTYKQIGVIQCQARKIANDKKAKVNGIAAH
ncbi:7830_t:CDS:2 [Acaulospora morrowiae]|uniref:7830_t:CDS:1 n=1 Tax=Acaulospora morrowiae TaxID=94023 RepID=A0A9N9DE94_9GLOM|nr:7830_t:CDS:2 [Acaulospora morrowiae]